MGELSLKPVPSRVIAKKEINIELYPTAAKSVMEKLEILTDAAKYDVACTSSGVDRKGNGRDMGNCIAAGICHSFSSDGRCISLLKILMSNECVYDCKYCVNRKSNDMPRATFTPDEICELTMNFYRRNYIEGLFLSSGIVNNPTYTMELIYQTLYKLRNVYRFRGYIHIKGIPGADPIIIQQTGYLADRMSVNLELPTAQSLAMLAPNKHRSNILKPMRQIQNGIAQGKQELALYKNAPSFVPAGQSTQMIIGATPESDYQIMSVAEGLYDKFGLKRVFYSAYVGINEDKALPSVREASPLLREHRLYQADWLLRYYSFRVSELLNEKHQNFNILLDPKCDWALQHLEQFPVEINRADYHMLLRVPGIGVKSAQRICKARRTGALDFDSLKKMGVVLKRALYFITCSGKMMYNTKIEENYITRNLLAEHEKLPFDKDGMTYKQLSLFDDTQENAGLFGMAEERNAAYG
ncbi:MAG: putative DNA modification/repair radical SAM protein [Lachnospiraceae bacterium]|nr:putative DNA modification/repair radical SAM protein [Lachnospiraceae bacterium]